MKQALPGLLIVACALGACATPTPSHREVVIARADVAIRQAPPPPIVETVPPAPASHFYWVAGHWDWDHGRYEWRPGHWVEPRPDQVFVQAYWTQRGDEWIFHPAHWQATRHDAGVAIVSAPAAPPPPRIEAITPPPGVEFVWISGHWRLERGQYVWEAGRWERRRVGAHWLPAHWVQRGPNWQYVPGRWDAD